jgi:hypothetical protein
MRKSEELSFVPEERILDDVIAELFFIVALFAIFEGRYFKLDDFGGWALNVQA